MQEKDEIYSCKKCGMIYDEKPDKCHYLRTKMRGRITKCNSTKFVPGHRKNIIDMHDALLEYSLAVIFKPVANPKVYKSKCCPVCHLIHSEATKRRHKILMMFYHTINAILLSWMFRKFKKEWRKYEKKKGRSTSGRSAGSSHRWFKSIPSH